MSGRRPFNYSSDCSKFLYCWHWFGFRPTQTMLNIHQLDLVIHKSHDSLFSISLKKWFKRILNWLWTHLCAISLFRSRLVIGLFQNLSGWPWFVWSHHKQFSCTFCTSWPRKLRFWKEICVLFWNLCITRACNNNLYLYSLLLKNKLRKWIY